MPNVWCVRAKSGEYVKHFLSGGFAAIGWQEIVQDLGSVKSRDELSLILRSAYPDLKSPIVIGNYVGQVARFLLEIKAGDWVITPAIDTDLIQYGQVLDDPSYFYANGDDGCPYRHRRRVIWAIAPLRRADFSMPFQYTMRAALTVFAVSQRDEFLAAIGSGHAAPSQFAQYDAYRVVLEQLLELDAKEFEILVGHLLTALGFEGSEVSGRTGDGGVDATGELNVANLVNVKVFVQAKRYRLGTKVSANTVKLLRSSLPLGAQGAFITTADYHKDAKVVASDPNFQRIGLINGRQLVDLLVKYWDDPSFPSEFRDRLGLQKGLVRT